MRPSEINEEVETFITKISHFVNVQNFQVLTGLRQSHETFGMKISTVEQIEVGQLGEISQELGEGQVRPTVARVAALHLMGVSVTVQTT